MKSISSHVFRYSVEPWQLTLGIACFIFLLLFFGFILGIGADRGVINYQDRELSQIISEHDTEGD